MLFKVKCEKFEYLVLANSFDEAARDVKRYLDNEDIGFLKERIPQKVEVVGFEVDKMYNNIFRQEEE